MKKLASFIVGLMLMIGLAIADPIFLHLNVDDFESSPNSIVLQVIPSNSNLFSSIVITNVSLDGKDRIITLQNKSYGTSQINVYAFDNGLNVARTALVPATVGVNVTNIDSTTSFQFKTYSVNNAVYLSWLATPNAYGYKVMRCDSNVLSNFSTIGITGATSIIDTNVIVGQTYWYLLNWVPVNLTNIYTSNIQRGVISFQVSYVNPVHLYYFPDGFGFMATTNTTYQVLYKTKISDTWSLLAELPLNNGQSVIYHDSNKFFRNKIFYVKEK